jgi:hypothetical protein
VDKEEEALLFCELVERVLAIRHVGEAVHLVVVVDVLLTTMWRQADIPFLKQLQTDMMEWIEANK